jgi:hypothetical protein
VLYRHALLAVLAVVGCLVGFRAYLFIVSEHIR